jgi:hypothetical protein
VAAGALVSAMGSLAAADEGPGAAEDRGPAFDARSVGLFTGVEVRTGQAGNSGVGQVGAEALGLRSLDGGGWLARWDAMAEGRGGYLAQGGPAPLLLGWQGRLDGELGRRLVPAASWSPYLGVQGLLQLQWLQPRGGATPTRNEMDFAEGGSGAGDVRLVLGGAYLDGSRSLVLAAFAQAARRPTGASAGELFTDGGLEARFDLGSRFSASLAASRGVAGAIHDRALGERHTTTHEQLDATLRLGLWRAAWFGLEGRASRDAYRISYSGGRTYRTADPPSLTLGLVLGSWLWR